MNPAVLYVENDPNSQMILKVVLQKRLNLSNVFTFDDSVDFIERVQALPVPLDLILLDIHVEPLNGFEMLAMLRQMNAYRKIPIVALTASVMNEEVLLLQTAGFDSCIAKPIDLLTFPALLESILQGEKHWNI